MVSEVENRADLHRRVEEYLNEHGIEILDPNARGEIHTVQARRPGMLLPKGLFLVIDADLDGPPHYYADFLLLNADEIVCDWTCDLDQVIEKHRSFVPIS